MTGPQVWTVGHGTLTPEALAALLRGAGVEVVWDIRRYPGSRRHPDLAREHLERSLPGEGVDYRWVEDLGGRRPVRRDSPHRALRDDGFRGYADHMDTPAFATALDELVAAAGRVRTAVMCAESVWWRCHRRLVADALVLTRGVRVVHLMHDGRLQDHGVTDGARAAGDRVRYDRGETEPLPLDLGGT